MSGIEVAESIAPAVASRIRVFYLPISSAPKLAVVAEAELPATNMASTVSAFENPRELFVCKGHAISLCALGQSQ